MKLFRVIRSAEWWAHKLPPLLAVGYATALMSATPLYQIALWLIFLLGALVIGAVYVSVINDITDLEEDIASGKSNRIQQIPQKVRWTIPAAAILFGFIFGYFLYPDLLSCLLYLLSWIVFSCYSIKPIRLKNRGILGVFADGCGSHLFPSLLMVSSVSYITQQRINWIWFTGVGIWAFCYGLRGILWHQFADRENDIKVKLNTYASKIKPQDFKKQSMLLITLELIALAILLTQLELIAPYLSLLLYIVLLYLRYVAYKNQVVLVIKPNTGPFQILMADYYQMFFPISLLIFASIIDNTNFIVLIVHILLFPYLLWLAIYDYTRIVAIRILQLIRKSH